jgi:phosphohistidine phosphatase
LWRGKPTEDAAVKHITLVRHATAVRRDPEKPDFNRPLKKSGRRESREMTERLKDLKVRPDLFVSSPANRALETAVIFAKGLKHPVKKIDKIEKLYEEISPEEFLELISGFDDRFESAIIFGHDPSFTEFAQFLVPGFDGDLPKCGVLGVELDVAVWADAVPELVKKMCFFYPGDAADAKARVKEIRRELGAQIEKSLASAVADFGIDGGKDLMKVLRKASEKLARDLAPHVKGARSGSVSIPKPRRREETQV